MLCYDAIVYIRSGAIMETTILTLRVPQETKEQLAKLAEATHRSQSFLGSEAIRRYIDLESWQIAEIQQAITEADAGDFATEAEFNSIVKKHAG
jgi:predicted transcriptional regulator